MAWPMRLSRSRAWRVRSWRRQADGHRQDRRLPRLLRRPAPHLRHRLDAVQAAADGEALALILRASRLHSARGRVADARAGFPRTRRTARSRDDQRLAALATPRAMGVAAERDPAADRRLRPPARLERRLLVR